MIKDPKHFELRYRIERGWFLDLEEHEREAFRRVKAARKRLLKMQMEQVDHFMKTGDGMAYHDRVMSLIRIYDEAEKELEKVKELRDNAIGAANSAAIGYWHIKRGEE